MSFKTELGKKISLTLDDPRTNITKEEIKAAMNTVVASNIFSISGTDIVEALDAKVVTTNTKDFDVVVF